MAVIFLRALIIYIILFLVLRLMGKRQIGELQPSELVSTLILSQIASQPIIEKNIPLSYGIVSVCAVVCLEVIASYLMTRVPFLKRFFVGKPSVLIERGKVDQSELLRQRITIEELMSQLRQQGVGDPGDVYYAVMEENGSISVLLKAAQCPQTRSDCGTDVPEKGMARLVISDGAVNKQNLTALGKNERWLEKRLSEQECRVEDVFMMTCSDNSDICIVKKQKRR